MKRRTWSHRQRSTRFAHSSSFASVGELVAAADAHHCERYIVCGDRPGGGTLDGWNTWARGELPDGWRVAERGHYWHTSRPVLHFETVDGSRTLEVVRAVSWLGESAGESATPGQARDGLRAMLGAVRAAWSDPALGLLSTPATMGRDLWARTIPWEDDIPTLDDDLQETIRATTGQGRWQLFTGRGDPDAKVKVHGFDMRFGYAALLAGMPDPSTTVELHGEADQDHWRDGGPLRYVRGRYRVRGRVPVDWRGVGLLGVPVDGHVGHDCQACRWDAGRGSWCWPDRPGAPVDAWADGAELMIAADAGWRFDVGRAITWEVGRGLDLWGRRLVDARAAVDTGDPAATKLARAALRMIVLTAIGAFAGRPHAITGTADTADSIPDGAGFELAGDGFRWTLDQDAAAWSDASHPEWSAAVWARCRARMASHRGRGLLHVDPARLVACRQDAMYVAGDRPDWTDDGKVGTLRPTTSAVLARWPASTAELLMATGTEDATP